MADYVYSVAIQVNSFQNNMADKTVWRINWGRINEYSLYNITHLAYTNCYYVLSQHESIIYNILYMQLLSGITNIILMKRFVV